MSNSDIILKNGVIVDCETNNESRQDVRISRATGLVIEIGSNLSGTEIIDCAGLHILPGWIDLRAQFNDPGKASRESILNGAKAAAHGGLTAVAARADTTPPVDNIASVSYVLQQSALAGGARVYPTGTITKKAEGKELAEIGRMTQAGAVGFTDGERTLQSAVLLHSAIEYASMFNKVIFDVPQNPELSDESLMHQGAMSAKLGMKGLPPVAEVIQIGRDSRLADSAGGRLHLTPVTLHDSIKIVRSAKQHNARVTADTSPLHLVLTDESLATYDTVFKVFPPLRTVKDSNALKAAYKEGVIDCIVSHHSPFTAEETDVEFLYAPFGNSTIETLVGVVLDVFYHEMNMPLIEIARRQSLLTRDILGVPGGGFKPGAPADFTIVNLDKEWTVDVRKFKSKGKNCALDGKRLRGGPVYAVIGGQLHSSICSE
ncbi:MAG: dihydroorotase [Planctomycetota bacterium]